MSERATHKIILRLPEAGDDALIGSLCVLSENFALATSVFPASDQGPACLEWLVAGEPEKGVVDAQLALIESVTGADLGHDWIVEDLPDIDWLAASYSPVSAFSIGRFYIYSAPEDAAAKPDGQIPLFIEAIKAFGSGEHGTTAGCLKALDDWESEGFAPQNILDLGTGSGILALAARRLWPDAFILATDIDQESVDAALAHAAAHNIKDITIIQSDGFAAPDIGKAGPYDLVIANILAAPLKTMAGDLAAIVAPEGYTLLSGMLHEQADDVIKIYADAGLPTEKARYEEGDWTSLILAR